MSSCQIPRFIQTTTVKPPAAFDRRSSPFSGPPVRLQTGRSTSIDLPAAFQSVHRHRSMDRYRASPPGCRRQIHQSSVRAKPGPGIHRADGYGSDNRHDYPGTHRRLVEAAYRASIIENNGDEWAPLPRRKQSGRQYSTYNCASAFQTISRYVFNRRRLSINLSMYVLYGIHKA